MNVQDKIKSEEEAYNKILEEQQALKTKFQVLEEERLRIFGRLQAYTEIEKSKNGKKELS